MPKHTLSTTPSPVRLFVSVGTRFPMDRLLNAVDDVCKDKPNWKAKAQTGVSHFESTFIDSQQWMQGEAFNDAVKTCDVFISHAGMGNILLAAQFNKSIVIMPRLSELNEHINDHQSGTANAFMQRDFVRVAHNSKELAREIEELLSMPLSNSSAFDAFHDISVQKTAAAHPKHQLIDALKRFIDHGQT